MVKPKPKPQNAPANVENRPSSRGLAVHLLLAIVVLTVLASHRCATVRIDPAGRFEDPDAAFHARRATRAVQEGTLLPPVFDGFENFPDGGRAVWPPLHDASLALLDRVGGASRQEPGRGMALAAALPVVELVLALLAAAWLVSRLGGALGLPVAAWLLATTPVLLRRGAYGEIDHNATEVLFALLLAVVAERVARASTEEKPTSLPSLAPLALAWAATVLVSLGFFAGLALSSALVAAGIGAAALLAPGSRRTAPIAAGYALAALALPVLASWRVTPDPGDPWRLGPVYSLVLSGAAIVMGLAGVARRAANVSTGERVVSGGAALVGLAIWLLSSAAARSGFLLGVGFLGSRDRWLSTIDEFQRVSSLETLAAACPALLVGALALVVVVRGSRFYRELVLPVAVPFALFLALGLIQKRFLPVAAAFAAVLAGTVWARTQTSGQRWLLRAGLAVGLLTASSTLLGYLREAVAGEPRPTVMAGEAAAAAIVELTPDPGDPPAWGVLAPWDYGHQILRFANRPVALNNFGSFHPGFGRSLSIFLDGSPSHAASELTALRLRYVLAAYPPNVLPGACVSLGQDPKAVFPDGFDPKRAPRYEPTAAGARTLLVRLHLRDAVPFPDDTEADRAALLRFRKLWESPEQGPGPGGAPVPFMKLFELNVGGSNATPHTPGEVVADFSPPGGRTAAR